jgi:DNA polymerase-1
MSSPDRRLFLLDAMALIYRAYYALNKNPRITSKGLNTSAILGFANTLFEVLKNENPTHIAVAFDSHAPTLRHGDYTEYKANRQAMPEDISISIPYIKALVHAFNIPVIELEGYEADDIIGTLAKRAEKEGFTVYMMTPDKDFGQLISENIMMYKPAKFGEKAEIVGVKEICEKFGISRPEQVIDMLGLWGDASDNIPGIPGIGEKTARELIRQFDNIENLIEHADEVANPRMREKVKEFADQARMSRSLATIILDVPIETDPDILERTAPDRETLTKLFDELEFKTFAKRIFTDVPPIKTEYPEEAKNEVVEQVAQPRGGAPDLFSGLSEEDLYVKKSEHQTIDTVPHVYHLVDTPEQRTALIRLLEKADSVCFDSETTSLDTLDAELVGMSIAVKPGEAWYVSMPSDQKECHEILELFRPFFENPRIEKTGQNIKYDMSVLHQYGIKVAGPLFDTMLAHYLIEPDLRHNMDFLAEVYLNYSPVTIDTLIGRNGKNQITMRQAQIMFPERVKDYAAEDADVTLQLKHVFEPMLADTNTRELFDKIETPLIPVLASMEAEGVRIDTKALLESSLLLEKEIKQIELNIYEHAGETFNIASPMQLGKILFDKLKISDKPKKTGKTGQYATGEEELVKLGHKHPIVALILDFRQLSKLKSTYIDALPAYINKKTGRLHTSYNQAVAATGRLSSNNPNLQNIPIRSERGREIRKAFVPRNEDYVLLSADYSQIELRIIAQLSGDVHMLEAFRSGLDIHSATASRVYGVPLNEVTRDMRRNAKMVNFGIIYGISAFGLSERLGITRKEAAEIVNQYFKQYSGIRTYMDKAILLAREQGYVETIMKRRRYLRDINSNNANIRGFAERNAINAPIQGSSADMIKIAMINIHKVFEEMKLRSRMILQVHDELVFDVHREEIEIVKKIVEEKMRTAISMTVPIEVEINIGENWLEAH